MNARVSLKYFVNDYRKDLQIYFPIFIEVLIPNKKSNVIEVVYKHPSMKHYEFNNNFKVYIRE